MADTYIVKSGDTLLTIFRKLCVFDFDVLWDHADNRAVRDAYEKRGSLSVGDVLKVPPEATTVALEANKHHTIVVKAPKAELVLLLESPRGLPLKNSAYELRTAKRTISGVTDADGVLREQLPMTLTRASLRVTPAPELREQAATECSDNDVPDCAAEFYEWQLALGHPPAEDISGFQARLNNLGYAIGSATGELNAVTEAALAAFQADVELADEVGLSSKTCATLIDICGC